MKFNFPAIAPSLGVLALLTAAPAPAFAQEVGEDGVAEDEIVVTGTQIRGVAATGAQTIAMDAEAIVEVGAFSPSELLSSLPQLGSFNGRFEGDPRGAFQNSVNQPNLRNLPGFNAASGSVTLVLMDGHRLTPVGVGEATIDPDTVPASVLQRVEVVTDGGSAIYGADAVSGVINFITRRSFEGVQVDANYGFGDTIEGFSQYDGTLTAGTSWGSGNGYVAFSHSDREGITNGETSWARQGTWQAGDILRNSGTQCRVPVGTELRYFWFGAGWTSNPAAPGAGTFPTGTPCNAFAEDAYLPQQERDNLFGSLTQELGDNIELHTTAYYTTRSTAFAAYPLGHSASIPAPAPAFPGAFVGQIVAVPSGAGFSFGVHPAYVDRDFTIEFETWGITPELTIDLGEWQLRGLVHYGRSENTHRQPQVNATVANAAIAASTLNPFNVAGASPAVINSILDWEIAQDVNHELLNGRAIIDGPLLQLPAGDLKVALGVEFANSSAETRAITGTRGALGTVPFRSADRDQVSAFAEASVPVLDALDLSFAVRYDDYSDFGTTTNPTVGFDLHPVDGLRIFGHWGKSFNAPTVLDSFAISTGRLIPGVVTNGTLDPFDEWNGVGTGVLQGTGSTSGLAPQTAEQFSFGGEFEPVDRLRLSVNYYEMDFTDILGAVNPQLASQHIAHPDKFIWNPTQAEFNAYIAQLSNQADFAAVNAATIGFILDRITDNLDSAKLTGLDFSIDYSMDTPIGEINLGVAGNQQISFLLNGVDNLAFNVPDLNWVGTVGWSGEHLRARLSINHTGAFDTNQAQLGQREVESFTTADLFVGYDLGALGAEGSSLRFAVDNVFDEDPPLWRLNAPGGISWSGFSLGRVVKVGVTAHF